MPSDLARARRSCGAQGLKLVIIDYAICPNLGPTLGAAFGYATAFQVIIAVVLQKLLGIKYDKEVNLVPRALETKVAEAA